uniref:BTB domain-containing protein n=1 Tax=Panagrolaimus sp. ES5 TaxID=591445 RepID=A0AC34FN31_9BILA
MDAKQNFYQIHAEKFEAFKDQDPGNEDFDVTFEVNGQKLYANKFMLWSASPTFKSMLSSRWRKTDEAIVLKNYSFEDFKEFLTFIYSGRCKFTDDNIFALVDIAEFYGISVLKNVCGEYLSKMEVSLNNVYPLIDLVIKYSLHQLKSPLYTFISDNLSGFLRSENFLNLEKSIVKDIVESNQHTLRQEDLFEAIFKWAERCAAEKQRSGENSVISELLKKELSAFLPLIKFGFMDADFLIQFVVKKYFIFTDEELKQMLWAKNKVNVKVVNRAGKFMKGELQCCDIEKVANVIRSKKNKACEFINSHQYIYWNTNQHKPFTPSKLTKNESIEWYLVYDSYGDLAVKSRHRLVDDNYLLAEMFTENGFYFDNECKIEVV